MNTKKYLLLTALLFANPITATAQITFPNGGTDGALNLTSSYTSYSKDLSQAVTGLWDQDNTANSGKGVYDPAKRAIVFKYSSVNLNYSSTTLSFTNHPSRAAVVWLVSGNVTINGSLILDGQSISYTSSLVSAEPGPGGFRGGIQNVVSTGLGIGGGNSGGNGTFASTYGNTMIVPLIGGSGGSTGGGGGGAILIAASGTITINGAITAYGGSSNGGAGSGGAIRLIANTINGFGSVNPGTDGRLRLEANSVSGSLVTTPQTIAVPVTNPPILWPASTAAVAKILSVDAVSSPVDPRSPLDLDADVKISKAAAASSVVTVQTQNFPTNGTVKVRAAGKFSATATLVTAAFQGGNATQATWTATVTFPEGYTTLQAIATAP